MPNNALHVGLVDLFIQQGNVEKDVELLQFGDPWSKLVALLGLRRGDFSRMI